MQVVLLEDVKSLGKKGQVVKVNDGYARNFILPKKLGVEATPKALNDLKLQNQHAEKVRQENLEAAREFKTELEKLTGQSGLENVFVSLAGNSAGDLKYTGTGGGDNA